MRRFKRRSSRKIRNRSFPHTVNISLPLGGFCERLNAMHLFCGLYDIPIRTAYGRWEHGYYHVDWIFSDGLIAGLFAERFGGSLLRAQSSC
jgi:hypothetical protein